MRSHIKAGMAAALGSMIVERDAQNPHLNEVLENLEKRVNGEYQIRTKNRAAANPCPKNPNKISKADRKKLKKEARAREESGTYYQLVEDMCNLFMSTTQEAQNDQITRDTVAMKLLNYLNRVDFLGQFKVICNQANNPPDVIEDNNIVATVFIKDRLGKPRMFDLDRKVIERIRNGQQAT